MNKQMMNKTTRTLSRTMLKAKKHSPKILMAGGLGLIGVATVKACKASMNLNEVLEETKEKIEMVHSVVDNPEIVEEEGIVPADKAKALTTVYAQTGLKLLEMYGPSLAMGAAGVVCILSSNRILNNRNVALTAAYATLENGFKDYRGRVIERFGEELDRELKYNIKRETVEEVVIDEEGNETVVETTVDTADVKDGSMYDRFFDETCKAWNRNSELNLFTIKQVQEWANQKLQSEGHLFLNDVYEAFGIPKTAAGQVVGWVYDEADPYCDNYVNFNVFDIHNKDKRRFVNGHEKSVLLQFNVDGDILDRI